METPGFMSPEMQRSMLMFGLGDIIRGGNGAAAFNYMGQKYSYEQAEAERQRQAEEAQAMAAQEEASRRAAIDQTTGFFQSMQPNPVMPFDRMQPKSIAADTMATLGKVPGPPTGNARMAAETNSPMASAMNQMFYEMPQDVRDNTRMTPQAGGGQFAYGTPDARSYARENAPRYGFGFGGNSPQVQFGAQGSMPMPIDPQRAAAIMQNPNIPDTIKEQVMASMVPQGPNPPDWKIVDGQMIDMNNPQAGAQPVPGYQAPAADEYERYVREARAAGETPMTRFEYRTALAEAGGTKIDMGNDGRIGTIPQGYMLIDDPNAPNGAGARMVAIPGGPEDTADNDAADRAGKERAANIVLEDIDRVLGALDAGTMPIAGAGGALLSNIPSTAAFDVSKTLDTIKANVGFDKLQQMRDASPTGGALGQVSEMENKLLQSVLGNLEQSQSEEQFRRNLERLRSTYMDIIHGPGNWTPDQFQAPSAAQEGGMPAAPAGIDADIWPMVWDRLSPEDRKALSQ